MSGIVSSTDTDTDTEPGKNTTPVMPGGVVSISSAACENMRAFRDRDATLSPEQLRGNRSCTSWDSDLVLDTTDKDHRMEASRTGSVDTTQNMDLTDSREDSESAIFQLVSDGTL